jgi:hypothetical protein
MPVSDSRLFQSRRGLKRATLRIVSESTKCEHMRSSTGASCRPGERIGRPSPTLRLCFTIDHLLGGTILAHPAARGKPLRIAGACRP